MSLKTFYLERFGFIPIISAIKLHLENKMKTQTLYTIYYNIYLFMYLYIFYLFFILYIYV